MNEDVKKFLGIALKEFRFALAPLHEAVSDQQKLYLLFEQLGWKLEGLVAADPMEIKAALGRVQDALERVATRAEEAVATTTVSEVVEAARTGLRNAFEQLPQLQSALLQHSVPAADEKIRQAFADDLTSFLEVSYLQRRWPIFFVLAQTFCLVKDELCGEITWHDGTRAVMVRSSVRRLVPAPDMLLGLGRDPAGYLLARYAEGSASPHSSVEDFTRKATTLLSRLSPAPDNSGLGGLSVCLDLNRLQIKGLKISLPPNTSVESELPLTDSFKPVVTVTSGSVTLSWPEAARASENEVVVFEEGGFALTVSGGDKNGAGRREVALAEVDGQPTLRLTGGFGVRMPEGLLVGAGGALVRGEAWGILTLSPAASPTLVLDSLRCERGDVRLGGASGLLIRNATAELGGLSFPLRQSSSGYRLTLTGRLALPASRAEASVRCSYDGQAFEVRSEGDIALGQGIRLLALKDAGNTLMPVLRTRLSVGGAPACRFEVSGGISIPGSDVRKTVAKVVGHLEVETKGGETEVASLKVEGEIAPELMLPGYVKLKQARVSLSYDKVARGFSVLLQGGLHLGAKVDVRSTSAEAVVKAEIFFNEADPNDIRIKSPDSGVRLLAAEEFEVFEAKLSLDVRTKPRAGEVPLSLKLTDGRAGMFRQKGATLSYYLKVDKLAASFELNRDGFVLKLTSGQLRLPAMFTPLAAGLCPNTGGGPSVAIRQGSTLKLTYKAAALPGVAPSPLAATSNTLAIETEGALEFSNIGFEVPQVRGLAVQICAASLVIRPKTAPALANVEGKMQIPLPGGAAQVDLHRGVFSLDGFPSGRIELGKDLVLFNQGGFTFTLLGAGCDECKDAKGRAFASGITVFPSAGFNTLPRLQLDGGIKLAVPVDVLTNAQGDQVAGSACGSVFIDPRADGTAQVSMSLKTISVGGTFHLGGRSGVRIENAQLTAQGIENLFGQGPANPFTVTLSGKILVPEGPAFGLKDAKFVFTPPKWLPKFVPGTVSYEKHQFALANVLPLRVDKAELTFKDGTKELPHIIKPQNLIITVSASVAVPPDDPYLEGRVDDLVVTFKDDGRPELTVRGIGMSVGALDIPPIEEIGGKVYFGGLNSPSTLFFAGNLVGSYEGYKVGVILAFNLAGPIGACIDFNAGSAGIPVDGYQLGGVLVTGASGGVSFVNSNEDPCAFTTYLEADGRPKSSLVNFPVAPMNWQQLRDFVKRRKQALKVLGAPPPLPLPGVGAGPAASGQLVNLRRTPPLESDFGIPCPGDCPPPTVNVFCQPHPDQAKFPNRVIAKFSSFDEAALKRLGITEERLASLMQTAGDRATAIAADTGRRLRTEMEKLIPPPNANLLGATRAGEIKALFDDTLSAVESLFVTRIRETVAGKTTSREIYEAVRDAAYAGAPCPDVTLKVTGTMTHQYVSSFLSCTGGVVVSTTGSAGVVGNLNLLGLPVGKLRGFFSATDAKGDPNPSLCGQVDFEMGPLYLGTLRAGFECDGCVTAVLNEFANLALCVTDDQVRRIAARVVPELDVRGMNRQQIVNSLTDSRRKMRFIAEMLSQPPASQQQKDCLIKSLGNSLRAVNPEVLLCGVVQAKLFGIPMGLEGAAVAARVSKEELIVAARCAPSQIIAFILYYVAANPAAGIGSFYLGLFVRDKALMSFRLELPDADQAILDAVEARFRSLADVQRRIEENFDFMLQNGVYAMQYELSPLGFKTFDAQWRVLIPELLDHPAKYRPSRWTPPEKRNADLPSRVEMLLAALNSGRLADPRWKGSEQELSEAFPPWSPKREKVKGLSLRKDYFPHGGHVGAAVLQMPKALTEPPPVELSVLLDKSRPTLERLEAAYKYVKNYILENVQAGSLAFYIPAPNPPTFVDERGQPLKARKLLESINRFDFRSVAAQKLYPAEQFFLRGEFYANLLGVPLWKAEIVALPPDPPARPTGVFRVTSEVPPNLWLKQFVEQATLVFDMRQSPETTIESRFKSLLARMEELKRGATEQALRDYLSKELLAGLHEGLPKVSLEAKVNLRIPESDISQLLQTQAALPGANFNAELLAFSPRFAPDDTGDGVLSRTRREGGIALRIQKLKVGGALGFEAAIDNAELSLAPTGAAQLPKLAGQFENASINFDGGAMRLAGVTIAVNSHPAAGEAYLSASGRLHGQVALARWLKVPTIAGGLSASLRVMRPPGASALAVNLSAAPVSHELGWPFTGGTKILIHGASPTDPFTFSTNGDWKTNVSLSHMTLVGGPTAAPLLQVKEGAQPLTARLTGKGVNSASLSVEVPGSASITAFPDKPFAIRLSGLSGAKTTINVASKFAFDVNFTMPPLQLGRFIVHGARGVSDPVIVKVDQNGLRVSAGARFTVQGITTSPLTLDEFSISTDGSFSVSAAGLNLVFPDFRLTCSSVTLARTWRGETTLSLKQAALKILSAWTTLPEVKVESLNVASTGEWKFEIGEQTIEVQNLFTLKGNVKAGMDSQLTPYVKLENGVFSATCLGISQVAMQGALTAKGVTGKLNNWRISVPHLVETSTGAWEFKYHGGTQFELSTESARLTLIGQNAGTIDTFTLPVTPHGFNVSFSIPDYKLQLPEVFEFSGGQCTLNLSEWSKTVTIYGTVCALQQSDDHWLLQETATISAAGVEFEAGIRNTRNRTLVDIPNVLSLSTQAAVIAFGRDANGGLYLKFANLALTLYGNRVNIKSMQPVTADGNVCIEWDSDSFVLGVFRLRGSGFVEFNFSRLTAVQIHFDGGLLRCGEWLSVSLGGFDISGKFDIPLSLPELTFSGLRFAPGKGRLRGANGVMQLEINDTVSFFQSEMNRSVRVDAGGNISGEMWGTEMSGVLTITDNLSPLSVIEKVKVEKSKWIEPVKNILGSIITGGYTEKWTDWEDRIKYPSARNVTISFPETPRMPFNPATGRFEAEVQKIVEEGEVEFGKLTYFISFGPDGSKFTLKHTDRFGR